MNLRLKQRWNICRSGNRFAYYIPFHCNSYNHTVSPTASFTRTAGGMYEFTIWKNDKVFYNFADKSYLKVRTKMKEIETKFIELFENI